MNDDKYSKSEALAPELLAYFKVPEYLLTNVYRKSNGFFDSHVEQDDDGHLVAFCEWNILAASKQTDLDLRFMVSHSG